MHHSLHTFVEYLLHINCFFSALINLLRCIQPIKKSAFHDGILILLVCEEHLCRDKAVITEIGLLEDHLGEAFYDDVDVFIWSCHVTLLYDDVILQVDVQLQVICEELHVRVFVLAIEKIGLADGKLGEQHLHRA